LKRSPSRALGLPINKVKVIEGALGITKRVPVEVKESLELRNKKRINIFPSKFSRKRVDIKINGFTPTFLKQIEQQALNLISKKDSIPETNLLQCFKSNMEQPNDLPEHN